MKSIVAIFATCLAWTVAGAAEQGSGPTDPQIAAIVVTANQVDIDAGTLAKSKAQSTGVREFAQRMITDQGKRLHLGAKILNCFLGVQHSSQFVGDRRGIVGSLIEL